MKSIPVLPREHYAEGVHGVPWRRIFKLRNTVAWRWYYKFGEEIPFEEFASEANQVLAECLTAFDPDGAGSFATFLYRALSSRMPSVARQEWAGTIARTYDGAGPPDRDPAWTSSSKWTIFSGRVPVVQSQVC